MKILKSAFMYGATIQIEDWEERNTESRYAVLWRDKAEENRYSQGRYKMPRNVTSTGTVKLSREEFRTWEGRAVTFRSRDMRSKSEIETFFAASRSSGE